MEDPTRLVLVRVEWPGTEVAFEAIELPWSDDDFRCFVPLRDSWPEPEVLIIRADEILSAPTLEDDAIERRVSRHWPSVIQPQVASVLEALELALAERTLIGLSTTDDEPDTLTIGWVSGLDPDPIEFELETIDPRGERDGSESFVLADVASLLLGSRWIQVLTLVTNEEPPASA